MSTVYKELASLMLAGSWLTLCIRTARVSSPACHSSLSKEQQGTITITARLPLRLGKRKERIGGRRCADSNMQTKRMEFGAKPGESIVERLQILLPGPLFMCTPQEQALLLYGGLPLFLYSGFRRKKPGEQTWIVTEETSAQ